LRLRGWDRGRAYPETSGPQGNTSRLGNAHESPTGDFGSALIPRADWSGLDPPGLNSSSEATAWRASTSVGLSRRSSPAPGAGHRVEGIGCRRPQRRGVQRNSRRPAWRAVKRASAGRSDGENIGRRPRASWWRLRPVAWSLVEGGRLPAMPVAAAIASTRASDQVGCFFLRSYRKPYMHPREEAERANGRIFEKIARGDDRRNLIVGPIVSTPAGAAALARCAIFSIDAIGPTHAGAAASSASRSGDRRRDRTGERENRKNSP